MKARMNLNPFQWQSLKTRVTLFTLAIFLISIWSLTFYISRMLREDMQRLLGEQQFSTVSYIAAEVNDALGERLKALEAVAKAIAPTPLGNVTALQAELEKQTIFQSLFNGGTFVTGLEGTAIASIPLAAKREGTNYMDRDLVAAALKAGKSTVGKPVIGKNLNAPIISMAAPIRDTQGKVIGALMGVTNLGRPNFLDKITQHRYGRTGGYLLIAPQYRLIVTASDKSRIMQPLPAPGINAQVDRFVHGDQGTVLYVNAPGVEILNSVKAVPVAGWYLAANLPTAEAFAPIRALQQRILVATLFLTLLAGVLTWWMLKRQLAPMFNAVKMMTTRSASDQPPQPLPITRQDEIGELIGSFNRLLDTLAQRGEALKESEAFKNIILNSMPAEVAVLDRDGVIVTVNQPWRQFALENGLTPGQSTPHTGVGTNYLAICEASAPAAVDDDPSKVSQGIRAVLAGSLPSFALEYPCDSPEQPHWYSLVVTPLGPDRQGVVVCHSNITQRKQVEAALSLTRISIEATSEALFWVTLDARIVDVNAAACRLLGYSRQELLQLRVADVNVNPQFSGNQWPQYFDELRQHGTKKFETEHRAKNGRLIPVEVVANYVQLDGIELNCAFVRDMTGHKQIEAALRAAKAEAEHANHAKSRFLAAASHDLRQPLAALALYVGVLKSRVMPANVDLVVRIQDCCDSLSELLTDLLDVSKLDAGIVTPKLSDFAVDDFLSALVAMHSAEAALKGMRLHWRRSGAVTRTDHLLLTRIVRNLVANAIRYTNKGGVLIACRRHAGKQWIEVWDTGVGIPADKTELVFEEFRQRGQGVGSGQRGQNGRLAGPANPPALTARPWLHVCDRATGRPGHGAHRAAAPT
jgi:PAS domain S-box-containing protein